MLSAADVTYILVDGEVATLEGFAEDYASHPEGPAMVAAIRALPVGEVATVGSDGIRVKRLERR